MPSPTCTVNGSATPGLVAASSIPLIALASTAGASYWSLTAISTDELGSVATVNASLSVNMSAKTATFTAPSTLGSAIIFQSVVGVRGPGLDANYVLQPSYFTTFKVNVLTSGGLAVLALNEIYEQSSTYGWLIELNGVIRAAGGGGTGPGVTTVTISSSSTMAAPTANTDYLVDTSGGAVTLTYNSTPATGVRVRFVDSKKSWPTHAFTFVPGGSFLARDPANVAGTDAASIVFGTANPSGVVAGESATLAFYPTVGAAGTWIP